MAQITNVGVAVMYTSIVLVPMVLVFLVAMQIRDRIREQKHFKEVGGKTLPLKGIRKVIEAISGTSKKNRKRVSQDLASRKEL